MLTRGFGWIGIVALALAALGGSTSVRAGGTESHQYVGAGGVTAGPTLYAQADGASAGGVVATVAPGDRIRVTVVDESGRPIAMRVSAFATRTDPGFVLQPCDATEFRLPPLTRPTEVTFLPLAGVCGLGASAVVSTPTQGVVSVHYS